MAAITTPIAASTIKSTSSITTAISRPSVISTVTGTALPSPQATGCGLEWSGPRVEHAVAAGPVNNQSWPIIVACCKGQPIQLQDGGCTAYCVAQTGDMQRLWNCFNTADGYLLPGLSYEGSTGCDDVSSVQPVGFGGVNLTCKVATTSSSSTISSTSSATRTSATSSPTGAASSIRPGNIGKFELAMVSMVFMGLFTGIML